MRTLCHLPSACFRYKISRWTRLVGYRYSASTRGRVPPDLTRVLPFRRNDVAQHPDGGGFGRLPDSPLLGINSQMKPSTENLEPRIRRTFRLTPHVFEQVVGNKERTIGPRVVGRYLLHASQKEFFLFLQELSFDKRGGFIELIPEGGGPWEDRVNRVGEIEIGGAVFRAFAFAATGDDWGGNKDGKEKKGS